MSYEGKTSKKGLIALCIAFLAFGVCEWVAGLSAMRTGTLIHGLSPTRAYEGYEVIFFGTLSIVVGVGGLWAVLRKAK